MWDVLERRVRVDECWAGLDRFQIPPEDFRDLREAQEYYRERLEVKRLEEELSQKGTARDKLILDLFDTITLQLGSGESTFRYLTIEEFQSVRSKVEPLSDEKITKGIREQIEYNKQKAIESGRFGDLKGDIFPNCIVGFLMPSPDDVDKWFATGKITEQEAREKKKKAFQRSRFYTEDGRIGMMRDKGEITKQEALQLRRLNAGMYQEE